MRFLHNGFNRIYIRQFAEVFFDVMIGIAKRHTLPDQFECAVGGENIRRESGQQFFFVHTNCLNKR